MSVYSSYELHPNIFVTPQSAAVLSIPTFAQDFKTAQFSINTGAGSNYDIGVIISNQFLPPNPGVAASPTNMWSYATFTRISDGVLFSQGSPYNPGPGVTESFNIETTGARWIFFVIQNYTTGTLERLDCMLFSNFT